MSNFDAFLVTSQSSENLGWIGNDGYSDELNAHYSYDSKVANGKNIRIGSHLVIKRDGIIVGIGFVHALEVKAGIKTLRKCPDCGKQTLEKRKQDYKCTACKNTCSEEQIKIEAIDVAEYRATYKNAWSPAKSPVTGKEFEEYLDRHDIQSAIRSLSEENLKAALKLIGLDSLPGFPNRFI